jgi:FkbM family methyltransferase
MRPYFFLGGNRGLTKLSSGEFFYVNTEDRSITPWILHGGYWEIFVDDILCALARPGDVFVDVGANMGYYTIKIGARVGPEGRVYSFEPNPETYEFLRDNVMINAFESRACLSKAAVGETAGEAWLSFERREPGGSTLRTEQLDLENEMCVPVVRLDDAIPADQPVHLVKIDVEGFEPLALKGMKGLLARSLDAAVVVELSHVLWSRFGDPVALLSEAAEGRDIYRIHHSGHLQLLPKNDPGSVLEPDFVSYLLLLPPTAERRAQVSRFLAEGRRDRPLSPQLSRVRRLGARLKSWLGAG